MAYPKIIALDFDGTCVQNAYPKVGKDIGAAPTLRHLYKTYNIKYMLWTMRTGNELLDAEAWLSGNSIPIWSVNVNPEQARWSSSPKNYANLYVDDTGLGMPLTYGGKKDHVNWCQAGSMLEDWCNTHAGRRTVK